MTWRRLVVADGTTGWTSRAFDNVRAARVRASARSLSLLSKSPDDPAFSEAEEIRVGDDIEGQIAARYGDGFYAVLWIIDGRTAADSLTLERLLLSHSTGESPSTDVNANWQLRDDGTIHVTRGRAGEERTAVYRYGGNRLTEVR